MQIPVLPDRRLAVFDQQIVSRGELGDSFEQGLFAGHIQERQKSVDELGGNLLLTDGSARIALISDAKTSEYQSSNSRAA